VRRALFALLLSPSALFCLFELSPYFGKTWEFYLSPFYRLHTYPDVQGAVNPSSYSSTDHILGGRLQVSFWPNWDGQVVYEAAKTDKLSWGTRSAAAMVRHLFLDDVQGDPVSLTLGGMLRYVPNRAQTDPSTPYHATMNLEVGSAVGKEWSHLEQWLSRLFFYGGLGIGNRGAPYANTELSYEGNWDDRVHGRIFTVGYFGFGARNQVNIGKMRGYANIAHHSIDIGGGITFLSDRMGSFYSEYAYRVYAHAFPEHAHTLTLLYTFPFSIF